MKVKTSFFLLVIFALSGCAKMTYQRRSANYQSIVHTVSHVVVMPANIEVNTLDIKGKKTRMYNYEYHLEDVINRIVVSHLEKKGFKVSVTKRIYFLPCPTPNKVLPTLYSIIRSCSPCSIAIIIIFPI